MSASLGVALVGLLLLPSASPTSSKATGATVTVRGRLLGLPAEKIFVSVEAVSLDDGSVAAAGVVPGSSYALAVPRVPTSSSARCSIRSTVG